MGRTDVHQGTTSRERASQSMGLVISVLFFGLALVPYPPLSPDADGWGYSGDLWYMRAFAVAVGLTGVRGALRLRRPAPAVRLEVGPDALRWSDGRGGERTIARAAVRRARWNAERLEFEPAAEPIRGLYVLELDADALRESLRHHGWLTPVDRRIDEARARAYPTFARRVGRVMGRLFGN
jgi:hypothetical protein